MESWLSQHAQVVLMSAILVVQVAMWASRQNISITQLDQRLHQFAERLGGMENQCQLQMAGFQASFVRRDVQDVQLVNIERRLATIENTLNDSQEGHARVLGRLDSIEQSLERHAPERRKEPRP